MTLEQMRALADRAVSHMTATTCPTCAPSICGLLEFTPADMLETPIVVGPPETWEDADE